MAAKKTMSGKGGGLGSKSGTSTSHKMAKVGATTSLTPKAKSGASNMGRGKC